MGTGNMMNATATPGAMMASPGSSHMMQPISGENVQEATETTGGQPLTYRMDGDVKVFDLTAKPVIWPITKDVSVTAWTYNGTVPGPMIRVTEGEKVRIILKNELPEPTTIHWHGIAVPNAMDGIPDVTQKPIQPGESFTYEFIAKPAGTYMYHSHYEGDVQVSAGLYAPFIIDSKEPEAPKPDVDVDLMISEWLVKNGNTFAAMPMAGMEPIFHHQWEVFPGNRNDQRQKGAARSSASDRDWAVRSSHPLAWGSIQNRGNGWSPGPRSSPTDQRYCAGVTRRAVRYRVCRY